MASAERMLTALRDEGLRITRARKAVASVLAASRGGHLSAADVHRLANNRGDVSVDQSTVYRTLETLEEAGLISHSHMGHQALVYHLADEPPHAHLVCSSCGKIVAVPESELAAFAGDIARETGFILDPTHVALSGLCPNCASETSPE